MPSHYGKEGKQKPIGGRKPLAGKPGSGSASGKVKGNPTPPKKKQPAPTRLVITPIKNSKKRGR